MQIDIEFAFLFDSSEGLKKTAFFPETDPQ